MDIHQGTDGVTVPIDEPYSEDHTAGAPYEYGIVAVTQELITGFTSQSFHIDSVEAKQKPFGGSVTGGWHTVALMMRLFARHYPSTVKSPGSPGADELRRLKPVRPGDQLHLRLHTPGTRLSCSDPRRGIVRALAELIDQSGESVLRVTGVNLQRTRDSA
ncbi:enoyl-CoA hydratase [Streptomyces viridiviolaceus]|uniref:MaoC/PaaZ C-terminal domain-containing protein n=1 Tax=Streptomyces viridiviolaceus TaxID=68282 RepID=A0ABW2EBB2_9ACTN|nr:MaoC/PaaZ C-terminal domain-containing protein [Streptomyces viridiviolaceus]GHB74748.1 enoyl-CoA hydratase [Streptomyces viridiviolaceus]